MLKDELDYLIKAAEEGDIGILQYLIQERKCDVDTRGPWGDPYVSQCTVTMYENMHAFCFILFVVESTGLHGCVLFHPLISIHPLKLKECA